MRVIDVAISTQERVRELPDRPYIATMCVVADVLDCLYGGFISERATKIIRQTIDVGKASLCGDLNSDEVALSAFLAMEAVLDDSQLRRPPLVNEMYTMIWVFAGEISGEIPLRQAPDYLGSAVLRYSGNLEIPNSVVAEFSEVDESIPGVRLLRGFWRTAELAERRAPLDPDAIRREVFGEGRQSLVDKLLGDGLR